MGIRRVSKSHTVTKEAEHVISKWTRQEAHLVQADLPNTTQPPVPDNFPVMNEDIYVWDTWPLMDEQNRPVQYNGWHVIFSLVAPRHKGVDITFDWNDRHGNAKIGYWVSRDAKSWEYKGLLFEGTGALGNQQWAGCTVLNKDNNITVFYTAKYETASIPTKVTGKIHSDGHGVFFSGLRDFIHLFEPDGVWYQTYEQNNFYGFRDPWFFRDPKTNEAYLLFEGNVGGKRGSHVITQEDIGTGYTEEVPAGANYQCANIGIAKAVDNTLEEFKLLPPLITATGVNDQTERPHFIFQDGKYYLFTISHAFTYAAGLHGPDGIYGFVSDNLFGPYVPLNGSGLVLGNPSGAPFQTYSHYIFPSVEGLLVESFIDSTPWAHNVEDKAAYRIGGTLAPTTRLTIDGKTTKVGEVLDYGYIPHAVKRIYRSDTVERAFDVNAAIKDAVNAALVASDYKGTQS